MITKSPKSLYCEFCDFKTSHIRDYNRHLKTIKHRKKSPNWVKKEEILCCECGKIYKHRSGLSRHKKICLVYKEKMLPLSYHCYPQKNGNNFYPIEKNEKKTKKNEKKNEKNEKKNEKNEKNKEKDEKKIKILEKKVESLKTKLLEQKVESLETQLKLKEETINAYEKQGSGTTNNFDNCYNNNISINVFLNEKCKNAMNLTDFVNQIKVQLEDVMYTQKHGPEQGITNILVKQLEDVPITERPIHCADVKRKKFYVKDEDEWKKTQPSKEMNGEKGPIERCIRNLKSKQHLVMETEWKNKNPDHETNPEKKDEYLDIENKIWKGCAKGESWSDYMKKMEKDIAEWSLPTLKEEMKEELENKN